MKRKIASILFAVLIFLSMLPLGASAAQVSDFTDVKNGAWYYDAVEYATQNGLFSGTSKTTFGPGVTMDRGMFVTVTGRLAEVPDTYGRNQSSPFLDLTQADYFYPFTVWANDNNIVNGTGGGKFSPKSAVTREQMATILFKYAQYAKYDMAFSDAKYLDFPDNNRVSAYAVDAMKWATYNGIINGISGNLEPQEKSTRAQVAQVLYNFSKLAPKGETPDPENPGGNWWENYDPGYVRKTGQSEKDANGGYFDYDMANEIMDRIDAVRTQNGLKKLAYHPTFQDWADTRAKEASINYSHTRPNGSSCETVGHDIHAENLAGLSEKTLQEKGADAFVTGWYESISHRHTMMNSAANIAVVSCYVKDGKTYAAHLFSDTPLYIFDM